MAFNSAARRPSLCWLAPARALRAGVLYGVADRWGACGRSRAAVGIGWLSLNLWLGSQALYTCTRRLAPGVGGGPVLATGVRGGELAFFLGFVLLHAAMVAAGLRHLQRLMRVAAALQCLGFVAMLAWALSVASGAGIAAGIAAFETNDPARDRRILVPMGITSVVAGWSTLTLNIADLSRFAADTRSFMVGQTCGFAVANLLPSLIGLAVAGAAKHAYDVNGWNLLPIFELWHPAVEVLACLLLAMSVLVTNMVANVVSPANDIANVYPEKITFKMGGYTALAVASVLFPWNIFADSDNYFTKFLVGYSMVTGAILAILVVDYFVLRRRALSLVDLYALNSSSRYWVWAPSLSSVVYPPSRADVSLCSTGTGSTCAPPPPSSWASPPGKWARWAKSCAGRSARRPFNLPPTASLAASRGLLAPWGLAPCPGSGSTFTACRGSSPSCAPGSRTTRCRGCSRTPSRPPRTRTPTSSPRSSSPSRPPWMRTPANSPRSSLINLITLLRLYKYNPPNPLN